ncbi:phosphotransferase [Streptomyces sp. B93]|uniref:phosphotransferase n=1 Tax=Streptomyces sp. B93 TaxID=2824875 RepID=UPI001B38E2D1|nr:phosphotransferase [Streptomyces sp. B93]MBQ1093390.1 phosphotransferase [Streptomyces sp. B93]
MTPDDDKEITALAGTLMRAYGLEPAEVTQIHGGTSTDNYRVTTHDGGVPWFAKVYRDVAQLPRERAAVELAEYARHGAVPVPAVRRTVDGDLVEAGGRLSMSLWEYIPDVHTAEGPMTNDRWRPGG